MVDEFLEHLPDENSASFADRVVRDVDACDADIEEERLELLDVVIGDAVVTEYNSF